MNIVRLLTMGAGVAAVAGCAVQPPSGPSFAAMPGNGKSFDQFRADDANCRGYANQSINGGATAQQATNNSVATAVGGAALGAAAGALIGSAGAAAGGGAAVGAGAGLLLGSAVGANQAGRSSYQLQRGFDVAYAQCMAAAGEAVPDMQPRPMAMAPYPAYPAYPAYPPYAYGAPVVVAPSVGFGWGWGRRW
jgi:hypothetical protein